ncbi:unnamed protein product [Nezara viridula]|uniref:BING4 C-terminal domain-containing protein n=1 Tax=Nezara viridula TaxID=85310 RepID=A0A9P0MSN3_NEZVI|nr:unnamed protein product [Nezara viridula]
MDSPAQEESLSKQRKERKNKMKNKKQFDPKLLKYSRGPGIKNPKRISNIFDRAKVLRKEKNIHWAEEQAARAEVLLTEEVGYIVPDKGEKTNNLTQKNISKAVDITSATKYFELDLKFGPYRFDYTRNGRHLLIGGKKGHVAAMDWVTKRLLCEINVMEEVCDVQWLHVETMFAAAQKKWVYIYDNQGVELHCIKKLYNILRMTFLPYHFLLATSNEDGWLSWLDISIGELVSQYNTREGRLSVMEYNPYNGVICLGHSKGVVTMWSPNVQKPLASMLCHPTGVQAIAIDSTGKYMSTSSANSQIKVWDLRNLTGPLKYYQLKNAPTDLSFSQRGCLAAAIENTVQIYKNCHIESVNEPYLVHKTRTFVHGINFCPYEDVLGISTTSGFSSILVPGSGEPNFDALEVNPFQTKSQRREAEVKSLLEKVQPEMIVLDPSIISEVDVPTLRDKIEAKEKLLYLKVPKIDFTPRKKKRGNTARAARVKKIVKENNKKEFIKGIKEVQKNLVNVTKGGNNKKKTQAPSVLDRFRKK